MSDISLFRKSVDLLFPFEYGFATHVKLRIISILDPRDHQIYIVV